MNPNQGILKTRTPSPWDLRDQFPPFLSSQCLQSLQTETNRSTCVYNQHRSQESENLSRCQPSWTKSFWLTFPPRARSVSQQKLAQEKASMGFLIIAFFIRNCRQY